jgi:hypothetical protein
MPKRKKYPPKSRFPVKRVATGCVPDGLLTLDAYQQKRAAALGQLFADLPQQHQDGITADHVAAQAAEVKKQKTAAAATRKRESRETQLRIKRKGSAKLNAELHEKGFVLQKGRTRPHSSDEQLSDTGDADEDIDSAVQSESFTQAQADSARAARKELEAQGYEVISRKQAEAQAHPRKKTPKQLLAEAEQQSDSDTDEPARKKAKKAVAGLTTKEKAALLAELNAELGQSGTKSVKQIDRVYRAPDPRSKADRRTALSKVPGGGGTFRFLGGTNTIEEHNTKKEEHVAYWRSQCKSRTTRGAPAAPTKEEVDAVEARVRELVAHHEKGGDIGFKLTHLGTDSQLKDACRTV